MKGRTRREVKLKKEVWLLKKEKKISSKKELETMSTGSKRLSYREYVKLHDHLLAGCLDANNKRLLLPFERPKEPDRGAVKSKSKTMAANDRDRQASRRSSSRHARPAC